MKLEFKLKFKVHVLPRYKRFASECLEEILVANLTVSVTMLKQTNNCFMSTQDRSKTVSCCKEKMIRILCGYITTKLCVSNLHLKTPVTSKSINHQCTHYIAILSDGI